MPFDAKKFCLDFNLRTAPHGHKHYRPGWVNIACPFCYGTQGFHLGLNIQKGYGSCYRCGGHWLPKIVSAISGLPINSSIEKIKIYSSGELQKEFKQRQYSDKVILPELYPELSLAQRTYLQSRNFNPDVLVQTWKISGTTNIGNYKFRIFIPIFLGSRLISFQTRDITKKQPEKYKACAEENEAYCHKFSLYGIDECQTKTVVITEGVFDVWRLGPGAVCTFGVEFTKQQVKLMIERFDNFFIFYDNDMPGINKAKELAGILSSFGKSCETITNTDGDPCDLSEDEARKLMFDLI